MPEDKNKEPRPQSFLPPFETELMKQKLDRGKTANVAVSKVGGVGTRTIHFIKGIYVGYTDS